MLTMGAGGPAMAGPRQGMNMLLGEGKLVFGIVHSPKDLIGEC